ncbi:heavy metal translocating P-type ATPase [Planktothricoides raciborskii]|uniref:Heavy metal translocating P-type ATPase n=1 Tax=Planktothricoides raciborskii FACHB-1370 TaxID=2949576 RepID=A0ABR8ED31_9CYAN|nr:heavy metal translocating P-type ATPase [Planktothricoides raciborskii]MBD2543496.1 heavy metal translocating P-type ATPase [Planktothricoides raciborskii FACHB-1370]MBD2581186.1 heavy metal translocating P-type ATPase [Planktothricoides raciborskii FACHB-1261]
MTDCSVLHVSSLVGGVQVIHAIPGRIRLRMPALWNSQPTKELTDRLKADPRIISVRINQACASIAIQYRPESIAAIAAPDYFLHFFDNPLIPRDCSATLPGTNSEPECNAESDTEDEDEGWSSLRLPILATLLAVASQRWPVNAGFIHSLLKVAAAGVLGACVLPVVQRASNSVFVEHRLNIDCLDLMAISLSTIQGKLITPALMMTLHGIGDVLREQTARSTAMQTADLLDTIGNFAWVVREDRIVKIKSDQVQVGEIVQVYPGEQIPVDGTVQAGEATVDQQKLTGESMPIVAGVGTYVYASTLVRSGKLRLIAEKVGNQTRAAASLALLSQAPVHDTRMANYAEKIADRLILPVLVLGTVVLMTTRDPARVAAIFTLDFVTGIRVSIPTAFLGALNHTTRHGILVRSGRTLEQLAEVDTMVFDKTGTLTQGDIQLSNVISVADGFSSDRVLELAAAAEQRITHPVAEAIVRAASDRGLTIPQRQDWHYEVGSGVRTEIDGQTVLVGNQKLLAEAGINLPALTGCGGSASLTDRGAEVQGSRGAGEQRCRGAEVQGCENQPTTTNHQPTTTNHQPPTNNNQQSTIYVACDGQLIGQISYTDPLRPESAPLVRRLRDLGIEVHLLTGDSQMRAQAVGEQLGISPGHVHAEAFPEEKARIVRDLHRAGKTVAFVGDGLNDSVALAYADVSVSFEDGSHVARETADVVLMNNDLEALLEAIAIAQDTQRVISENTVLVVGPNLLALGLATTVGLNPLVATMIHNGSAIAAGLNSLRPLIQHQLTG